MARATQDILGDSFVLPDDLSALGVEDSYNGFPSRPCLLPDEMRGALLLPSDPGSSYSSRRPEDSSFGQGSLEDSLISRGAPGPPARVASGALSEASFASEPVGSSVCLGEADASAASPSAGAAAAAVGSPQYSAGRSSGSRPASTGRLSPAPSSGVGLGGAQDIVDSSSPLASSAGGRDWSLSDTDLKELLDSPGPMGSPLGFAGGPLGPVPEGGVCDTSPKEQASSSTAAFGSGSTRSPPPAASLGGSPSSSAPRTASSSTSASPSQASGLSRRSKLS